jgi:DNA polymerase III, epsilon subunit, Proteobacterial
MRQIILDTETTGLETSQGHRIIEIGAVEMVERRITGKHYHVYINPQREVDEGAVSVHGITNEFLDDKPLFATIVDDFMAFVGNSELVIHNAAFDIGFINYELSLLDGKFSHHNIENSCAVLDTLKLARDEFPGQRNNLDALCKRYGIDNSNRTLHGALLDAEILADVYLALTGGQINLLADVEAKSQDKAKTITKLMNNKLVKVMANDNEVSDHERYLQMIEKQSGEPALWSKTAN